MLDWALFLSEPTFPFTGAGGKEGISQAQTSCPSIIAICFFLLGLRKWVGRSLRWGQLKCGLTFSFILTSSLKGLLPPVPKCHWDGQG